MQENFRRGWHLLPLPSAAALQKRAPRGLRGVPNRPWPRARPYFRTIMHTCAFPCGKGCLASERARGRGRPKGCGMRDAAKQPAGASKECTHLPNNVNFVLHSIHGTTKGVHVLLPRAARLDHVSKGRNILLYLIYLREQNRRLLECACHAQPGLGGTLQARNYYNDAGERGSQSQPRANKGASTTSSLRWVDIFRCWSSASATSGCISPRMARSAMATFLCAPLLRACSWWPCAHADGVPVSAELVLAL